MATLYDSLVDVRKTNGWGASEQPLASALQGFVDPNKELKKVILRNAQNTVVVEAQFGINDATNEYGVPNSITIHTISKRDGLFKDLFSRYNPSSVSIGMTKPDLKEDESRPHIDINYHFGGLLGYDEVTAEFPEEMSRGEVEVLKRALDTLKVGYKEVDGKFLVDEIRAHHEFGSEELENALDIVATKTRKFSYVRAAGGEYAEDGSSHFDFSIDEKKLKNVNPNPQLSVVMDFSWTTKAGKENAIKQLQSIVDIIEIDPNCKFEGLEVTEKQFEMRKLGRNSTRIIG